VLAVEVADPPLTVTVVLASAVPLTRDRRRARILRVARHHGRGQGREGRAREEEAPKQKR